MGWIQVVPTLPVGGSANCSLSVVVYNFHEKCISRRVS
jgi:hypothetical protein